MTTQVTSSRAANGTVPGRPAGRARNLPTAPRRYGQWVATLLVLLGSIAAAGWFWQNKGDQVEVLVARVSVPAGAVVERDDLATAEVSGVAGAIPVGELDDVLGLTAAAPLTPGQVLISDMVTTEAIPAAGQRVVGLELDATRTPAGLVPGDVVLVIAVPTSGDAGEVAALGDPEVLADAATVHDVTPVQGGGTRISLVGPEGSANRVAAFGAAGRVALLQQPLGAADPTDAAHPPGSGD